MSKSVRVRPQYVAFVSGFHKEKIAKYKNTEHEIPLPLKNNAKPPQEGDLSLNSRLGGSSFLGKPTKHDQWQGIPWIKGVRSNKLLPIDNVS